MEDYTIKHEDRQKIEGLEITSFRTFENYIIAVYGYNYNSNILGKETLTNLLTNVHYNYLKNFTTSIKLTR